MHAAPTPGTNPYYDDGRRRMLPSFVLFMDFLGMKELWNSPAPEDIAKQLKFVNRYSEELESLTKPLEVTLTGLKPQTVTFSDNIAVTFPITDLGSELLGSIKPDSPYNKTQQEYYSDNNSELAMLNGISDWIHFVSDLTNFQMRLAAEGYFLRGAFTFGPIFAEPGLIAGPALVDAAGREHSTVQMPFIAAPDQIAGIRNIDSFSYGTTNHSFFDNLFAHTTFTHTESSGGSVFVHYLAAALGDLDTAPDTATGDRNILVEHRDLIVANLQITSGRVRSKYAWLARYHNWFCEENKSILNKSSDDVIVLESEIGSAPDLISFQSLKDYATGLK